MESGTVAIVFVEEDGFRATAYTAASVEAWLGDMSTCARSSFERRGRNLYLVRSARRANGRGDRRGGGTSEGMPDHAASISGWRGWAAKAVIRPQDAPRLMVVDLIGRLVVRLSWAWTSWTGR